MGGCFSADSSNEQSFRIPPSVDEETQAKQDAALKLVESRTVASGTTRMACLYSERGMKGKNQDVMILWENFLDDPQTTLVAVIDGHGPHGHLVAQRVRDSLPSRIAAIWHDLQEKKGTLYSGKEMQAAEGEASVADTSSSVSGTQENDGTANKHKVACPRPADNDDRLVARWRETLTLACADMDREVSGHPKLDPETSGAAMVLAVLQDNLLVLANLGDCRALLATSDPQSGILVATQLTEDHKCSEPKERDRIRSLKGRVFALDDEPHVMRVWLPYQMRPGLAMSRAFGDLMLKNYGVTCLPDVQARRITGEDCFLLLASDGLWDVMSNEDAVKITDRSSQSQIQDGGAAKVLVDTAKVEWSARFPNSRRDDCTCAVLYLRPDYAPLCNDDMAVSAEAPIAPDMEAELEEALKVETDEAGSEKVTATTVVIDKEGSPEGEGKPPTFNSLDSEDSTSDGNSLEHPVEVVVEGTSGLRFFRNDTIGNLQSVGEELINPIEAKS